jgi:hypothetical protein
LREAVIEFLFHTLLPVNRLPSPPGWNEAPPGEPNNTACESNDVGDTNTPCPIPVACAPEVVVFDVVNIVGERLDVLVPDDPATPDNIPGTDKLEP